MMEALIPLISSLLSSLFVDGLERGFAFGTLAGMAVFGVAVLFAMNAIRGKMERSGLPHTEYCNDLVEWEFYEKSMKMSYAQADSPETAALLLIPVFLQGGTVAALEHPPFPAPGAGSDRLFHPFGKENLRRRGKTPAGI